MTPSLAPPPRLAPSQPHPPGACVRACVGGCVSTGWWCRSQLGGGDGAALPILSLSSASLHRPAWNTQLSAVVAKPSQVPTPRMRVCTCTCNGGGHAIGVLGEGGGQKGHAAMLWQRRHPGQLQNSALHACAQTNWRATGAGDAASVTYTRGQARGRGRCVGERGSTTTACSLPGRAVAP